VTATLEILDVRLCITCDDESLIEPFLGVFSSFAVVTEDAAGAPPPPGSAPGQEPAASGSPSAPPHKVQVTIGGTAGTYEDGARHIALAAEPLRRAHVYNLLYTTLVRALGGFYLLHAAVVARRGRAWVISGPSGSGKTTLGRALAGRGFDLLTDDLAPLAVQDGLLHPFPRRLGLDRGGGAAAPDYVRLGDKDFVTAGALGLAVGSEPVPVAGIVIMNPYAMENSPLRWRVGVLPAAAGLADRLAAEPGVSVTSTPAAGGALILEVTLDSGASVAAVMETVAAADEGVLFHSRDDGGRRHWAPEPVLEPIPLRRAAIALLRETLNREPGSALMIRHRGSSAMALLELIGLLAGAPCYQLQPAGKEATAEFLARELN
jgi:hypothetical protein